VSKENWRTTWSRKTLPIWYQKCFKRIVFFSVHYTNLAVCGQSSLFWRNSPSWLASENINNASLKKRHLYCLGEAAFTKLSNKCGKKGNLLKWSQLVRTAGRRGCPVCFQLQGKVHWHCETNSWSRVGSFVKHVIPAVCTQDQTVLATVAYSLPS
jgi:hypothetical protein